MKTSINFEEYDGMYKRIVNSIEIEEPLVIVSKKYYENGTSEIEPLIYKDEFLFGKRKLFINESYFIKHKQEVFDLII